ncbi:hypothetical protein ZHAS_00011979 [Anopheles sinensis]|uniref:Uncharacterized protein n=1 Tax=Anopheles sinensis TaxID=74873 RepID=A0A084W1P8_ANOSI|nr:hypothetical protein ZHAS_00011979 [Anopheles sinensis]
MPTTTSTTITTSDSKRVECKTRSGTKATFSKLLNSPAQTQSLQTPRYTTVETSTPRRDESYTYSKTYKTVTESSSSDPYSRPSTSSSSYTSTSERNSRGGPGGYSYSTERTSTTGGGPGGYSYSSTTSGRLPHGTTYRHYSYRFNTITTTTTTTYRTPMPYVAHKRLVPVTRVVSSPPRVLVSPLRVLGSPVRVVHSPVRVYGTPVRTVRAVRSPARVIVSPARIVTIRSPYLRPSIINKEFDRIERKYRASPVSSALEQYYNSPSYLEFEDEKRDIRNSTALLLRQLNDPVPRMLAPVAQAAPEPNPKKWVYDPFSTHNRLNSDTYVKSHITDPIRSVRNDIEAMARYHSPASRYVGKNHLASTRIIGSQAYPKTKPRIYNYDTAKVGKDVNVMSYYKSNRTQAKADVEEGKRDRVQRKQDKQSKARSKARADARKQQTPSPPPPTPPPSTLPQPSSPTPTSSPLTETCPVVDSNGVPTFTTHEQMSPDRLSPEPSSP